MNIFELERRGGMSDGTDIVMSAIIICTLNGDKIHVFLKRTFRLRRNCGLKLLAGAKPKNKRLQFFIFLILLNFFGDSCTIHTIFNTILSMTFFYTGTQSILSKSKYRVLYWSVFSYNIRLYVSIAAYMMRTSWKKTFVCSQFTVSPSHHTVRRTVLLHMNSNNSSTIATRLLLNSRRCIRYYRIRIPLYTPAFTRYTARTTGTETVIVFSFVVVVFSRRVPVST